MYKQRMKRNSKGLKLSYRLSTSIINLLNLLVMIITYVQYRSLNTHIYEHLRSKIPLALEHSRIHTYLD